MNALKKIFLLTLLSVFSLSAFCQQTSGTEILGKITINRSADLAVGGATTLEPGTIGDDPQMGPQWPWWWFLYRVVTTEIGQGSMSVSCYGLGWKLCIPVLNDLLSILKAIRGLPAEAVASSFENIITESEELAAGGMYQGSLSKKIAIPGDKINLILLQMNWNYDPKNPYDGKAEIIISKTENLGF